MTQKTIENLKTAAPEFDGHGHVKLLEVALSEVRELASETIKELHQAGKAKEEPLVARAYRIYNAAHDALRGIRR